MQHTHHHPLSPLWLTLAVAVCLALTACEKGTIWCLGNCDDVSISGRVMDGLTNTGKKGVPLRMTMTQSTCFLCWGPDLTGERTDKQGFFHIDNPIDTSEYFDSFSLDVCVEDDPDCLILPSGPCQTISHDQYQNVTEVNFTYYPRVALSYVFRNAPSQPVTSFVLEQTCPGALNTGIYTYTTGGIIENNAREELFTLAGLMTYIQWKLVTDQGTTIRKDSFFLSDTTSVVYEINL